jgi:Trypsin
MILEGDSGVVPDRRQCQGRRLRRAGLFVVWSCSERGYGVKRCLVGLLLAAVVGGVVVGGAAPGVRLIGGSPIAIQSAPWAVIVRYSPPNSSLEYDCTGSIVTASIVVTSAFCLYDSSGQLEPAGELSITAGVSNLDSPTSTDTEEDRTVGSVRVHPGFVYAANGGDVATDDVASLTLVTPLNLNGKTVQPVALPAPNTSFPAGTAVTLAAFGAESAGGEGGQLDAVASTVEAQGHCGAQGVKGLSATNGVVLCASAPGASMCDGDGGGPLTSTGAKPVLEGIAVAATQQCSAGSETIFTYVGAPEILAFIQGNNSTQPTDAPRPSTTTSWSLDWFLPLVVGSTLRCTTGGWGGSVKVTYAFMNTATGQTLQSGTSGKYVLPASAVGTSIDCQISVTNGGGTTVETTNTAADVKPAPTFKLIPSPLSTTRPGEPVKLAVLINSPSGLAGLFEVCANVPAAVVAHRCSSTDDKKYGIPFEHQFNLTFEIKPTATPGPVHVAIAATAGVRTAARTVTLLIKR